jgi:hypothetical protein
VIANNPVRQSNRSACSYLGIIFNEAFQSYAYVIVAGKSQVFNRIDLSKAPKMQEAEHAISLHPDLP